MAHTLAQIYDKHMLVVDIATYNFLLNSDLSIKLYNFTKASVLLLDIVIEAADNNRFLIQIDIR